MVMQPYQAEIIVDNIEELVKAIVIDMYSPHPEDTILAEIKKQQLRDYILEVFPDDNPEDE
jgi:hypothetical protein